MTSSPSLEQVAHLRALPTIRERCGQVLALAEKGDTQYWTLKPDKQQAVVDYTAAILTRDFGSDFGSIPPHGRWQHFDALGTKRVEGLLSEWHAMPSMEQARKLIDLFLVSVLLDAGAGPSWVYTEPGTGTRIGRSEGLAVASLHMFVQGLFSSGTDKAVVDAAGLERLTPTKLADAMQVTPSNPMDGLEGRASLLARLGATLTKDPHGFFVGPADAAAGHTPRRPGNLVDYLASHPTTRHNGGKTVVQVPVLWEALVVGLNPIWPAEERIEWAGQRLGDVWPCDSLHAALKQTHPDWDATELAYASLVPFHKLTQWLCYSLLAPMTRALGWVFEDGTAQTGLPEYRNGGLFMDLGLLQPTEALYRAGGVDPQDSSAIPSLSPNHPAVIEWRALTVALLDRTADALRAHFALTPSQLSLPQVLEAATWKGGREIAAEKRAGGVPPIKIVSDGTVF